MSKLITVFLGGQERTLDVGKFRFTQLFGEAIGQDPITMEDVLSKPGSQFDFVASLVYAGLQTSYKSAKKEQDFTREDVNDWVGDLEQEEVSALIDKYADLRKLPTSGEGQPQAAGG